MELRQLEMLLAVAETGTVTGAAQKLLLAQPSVTTQLRALEEELGYRLMDRLPRGVQLTDVGGVVAQHARNIFEEIDEMRSDLEEHAGLRRGRLAVGSIPTLITSLIPTVVTRFHKAFPGVRLTLQEWRARTLVSHVANHRLHMAIIGGGNAGEGVRLERLYDEELVVIMPSDDPLAGSETVRPAALRGRPFLILETGFGLRTIILEACRSAGFAPDIAMEMESVQAIKSLVRNGFGVSIVPVGAITFERQTGLLSAARLEEPRLTRPVQLVTPDSSRLPRAVEAFREICRDAVAQGGLRAW